MKKFTKQSNYRFKYYKKLHLIMDEIEFLNKHWFMYHKLEDNFLEIEKTIPIDLVNSNTFSYAYMKLLGSICIEFNECLKNFAKFNSWNCNSVNQCKQHINQQFPEFINTIIVFADIGYEKQYFKPFENWIGDNDLYWWKINNKIKHERNIIQEGEEKENYKLANQNCILTALSGLFQLDVYFNTIITHDTSFETLILPSPKSKIFSFYY